MNSQELQSEILSTAERALAKLAPGSEKIAPKTAWELKVELKVSHTLLHLALGMLLEQGKIRLHPERLTLVIEPVIEMPHELPPVEGGALGVPSVV